MNSKKEPEQNFLSKILQDKSIQQEWQKKFKTEQTDVLSSDEEERINKDVVAVRTKINKIAMSKQKKSPSKAPPLHPNEVESRHKVTEMSEFKTYTTLLIEQNLMYAKQVLDTNAALKEMYCFAKSNFNSIFKDKWFITVQKDKQDPLIFIKQVTKLLYILSQSQSKFTKLEEDLEKLNSEKSHLSKNNQRLMTYIEQRKSYTDSLKQKIQKLKSQIVKLESKGEPQKVQQINTDSILQKLDIKYMNRSDLILIVKSLMQKIKKHSKQCKNDTNRIGLEELQKFYPKDLATAIKRSNSKNASREGSRNPSKQKSGH